LFNAIDLELAFEGGGTRYEDKEEEMEQEEEKPYRYEWNTDFKISQLTSYQQAMRWLIR